MANYNPYSIPGTTIGNTIRLTRQYCLELIDGQGDYPYQAAAQCMLTKLTAYEVAIVSSRQYMYVVPDTALETTPSTYPVQSHAMAGICWRDLCVRTRPFEHGT
jgi:hypothetical protein